MFSKVLINNKENEFVKEYSLEYFESNCNSKNNQVFTESIHKFFKNEGLVNNGFSLKDVESYYDTETEKELWKDEDKQYKFVIQFL